MTYLFGQLLYPYPWLLAALVTGFLVGWAACGSEKSDS
jgi:uncharacterized membrane protein YccC